jgi:hypothetical protein
LRHPPSKGKVGFFTLRVGLVKDQKQFLERLYLGTDRWLQNNWKGLLIWGYIFWMVAITFSPDPVDFDAISAHLD